MTSKEHRLGRCLSWAAGAALVVALAAPATAADYMQSALVSVSQPTQQLKAAATGGPETVVFSGQVVLKSRLAKDPAYGEPKLLLDVDLSQLKGVGQSSGATYVTNGSAQLMRNPVRAQTIEISFAFARSAEMPLSSTRSGRATLTLDVDLISGAVMSGLASVVDR